MLTVRAPGRDHGLRNGFQVLGLGARAVLGRKLHVVHMAPRQLHRGHGFVQHLRPRLFELVLQMNVAGGDEGVDARPPGVLQGLGGAFHIQPCSSAPGRPPGPRETRGSPLPPPRNPLPRRWGNRLPGNRRPDPPACGPSAASQEPSYCSPAIARHRAGSYRKCILGRSCTHQKENSQERTGQARPDWPPVPPRRSLVGCAPEGRVKRLPSSS